MTTKSTNEAELDGETLTQYLSKLQFNAAKWAYMKLQGALAEDDAAAKLFADRQLKAAKIEDYIAQEKTKLLEEVLGVIKVCRWNEAGNGVKGSIMWSQQLGHEKAIDQMEANINQLIKDWQ